MLYLYSISWRPSSSGSKPSWSKPSWSNPTPSWNNPSPSWNNPTPLYPSPYNPISPPFPSPYNPSTPWLDPYPSTPSYPSPSVPSTPVQPSPQRIPTPYIPSYNNPAYRPSRNNNQYRNTMTCSEPNAVCQCSFGKFYLILENLIPSVQSYTSWFHVHMQFVVAFEGRCNMDRCEYSCSCDGGRCKMSNCRFDCTCHGGRWANMTACDFFHVMLLTTLVCVIVTN